MRRVGFVALTWIALFWLWLAYQGEFNSKLIIAAAATATVATALAVHVRARFPEGYRLQLRWAVRAAHVPWDVVREFVVVTRVLVSALARGTRPHGSFRLVPFPVGRNEPVARARRAFVTVVATYSPNSFVVGMHPDEGGIVMHDLDPRPPEESIL